MAFYGPFNPGKKPTEVVITQLFIPLSLVASADINNALALMPMTAHCNFLR